MAASPYSSSPLPYAPTPFSYTPLPPTTSTINLDEEVKLYTTNSQRELYESLAELFSIITTLEHLEKAFIRDTIAASAYTPTCQRLLSQYRTLLSNPTVSNAFGSLEEFKKTYSVDCPSATRRLETGLPATIEHPGGGAETGHASSPAPDGNGVRAGGGTSAKLAAEATQHFITFMDALRLNFRAKDELHPLLANVITSVDAVTGGGDFEGRKDIVRWLIRLNAMKAGDEITEDESRQCLFDIEGAYNAFYQNLQ